MNGVHDILLRTTRHHIRFMLRIVHCGRFGVFDAGLVYGGDYTFGRLEL